MSKVLWPSQERQCRKTQLYTRLTQTPREAHTHHPTLERTLTLKCGQRCLCPRLMAWWSRGLWSGKNICTRHKTADPLMHGPSCTHTHTQRKRRGWENTKVSDEESSIMSVHQPNTVTHWLHKIDQMKCWISVHTYQSNTCSHMTVYKTKLVCPQHWQMPFNTSRAARSTHLELCFWPLTNVSPIKTQSKPEHTTKCCKSCESFAPGCAHPNFCL